jgi:hypothetical protein
MWGISVPFSAKPNVILGMYEGHTVNIAQFCQFQKGKERTSEFHTLVFLCTGEKSAQAHHRAIPS